MFYDDYDGNFGYDDDGIFDNDDDKNYKQTFKFHGIHYVNKWKSLD